MASPLLLLAPDWCRREGERLGAVGSEAMDCDYPPRHGNGHISLFFPDGLNKSLSLSLVYEVVKSSENVAKLATLRLSF